MRKLRLGELSAHVCGGSDGHGGGDGPALVLMHGFGAPGTDLIPLAEELELPDSVRCVFPMAPHVLAPGSPDGQAPRAWWMIDMIALQIAAATGDVAALTEQDPPGLAESRQQLEALLQAVQKELGVPPGQIILGGFSQGAMLATDVALNGQCKLAGLAILSGSLLKRSLWQKLAPSRRGLPVFMSHGMADPILPFAVAEQLEAMLRQAGLHVDFTPFSGGHGIPALVLSRLGAFARRLLV